MYRIPTGSLWMAIEHHVTAFISVTMPSTLIII